MRVGRKPKPIQYINDRQYNGYAITPTGMINVLAADATISIYAEQAANRLRICYTTTDPAVFFYSYDFALKRYIDINTMSQFAQKPCVDGYTAFYSVLSHKQDAVHKLILRCVEKCRNKILELKTDAAKNNHIDKFQTQLTMYEDEMSTENRNLIISSSGYLRSLI